MGEITKLEFCERLEAHMGKADMAEVLSDCRKAAACIREMVEKREGLEEDLYQAVLVAYRRGALEWTHLNYPQWINAISAGREVCPQHQEQKHDR